MTSAPVGPVVHVERLTKAFGGLRAVTEVTFDLLPGGIAALIGPNGAGKTTIFNLMTGALRADEGSVSVNGRDITGLPVYRRARLGIGRTFQDVRLFGGMSVGENVEVYAQRGRAASVTRSLVLPRSTRRMDREAKARARATLELIGVGHLERQSVDGLSYAEQKLVAIARILAMGATTLLMDEPASGVDEVGRDQLCGAVQRLAAENLTVCIIEHNLDVVRRVATRVVFLAEGRILASGAPDEIFESSELAEVYFGSGAIHG